MKILIVKTSALGDILQTFPAVAYLRKKFPDALIDWVVEKRVSEVVKAHPGIDTALVIDMKSPQWSDVKELRKKKYDILFDFQGNIKSGIISFFVRAKKKVGFAVKNTAEWPNMLFTTERYALPAGRNIRDDYLSLAVRPFGDELPDTDVYITLRVSDDEKQCIAALMRDSRKSGKEVAVVCPGTRWENKKPSEQCLKQFLEHIGKRYFFLFLWGDEKEKNEAHRLHSVFKNESALVERMSVPALQNLISESDLVISMDSMPLHLAGTTSTATFALFGPSSALKYNPQGDKNSYFQGSCPYGLSFEKRCSRLRRCQTGACMKNITGEMLYERYIATNGCP